MEASSNGGGFFRSEDEWYAAMERDLGPDAAREARRAHERARNPVPLTESESAELRMAVEPVLADLRATGAIVADLREESWDDDPRRVTAFLPGQGIHVTLDDSLPARIADLADQVQEWEIEELFAAGRSPVWPECPLHPDSHPLSAQTRTDEAVWRCPASGTVICAIGALT